MELTETQKNAESPRPSLTLILQIPAVDPATIVSASFPAEPVGAPTDTDATMLPQPGSAIAVRLCDAGGRHVVPITLELMTDHV